MITKGMVTLAGTVAATAWLMPLLQQFPEFTGLIALAGLAGGFCRWRLEQSRLWPNGLSLILSGMLVSVFLWPLGQPLSEQLAGRVSLDPPTAAMAGGFITGVLGLTLVGAVMDVFNARRKRMGAENVD